MIQDIAPHRLYNAWQPDKHARSEDFVICVQDGRLLVEETADGLRFPRRHSLPASLEERFLFSLDDADFYLTFAPVDAGEGRRFCTLRELRRRMSEAHAFMYVAYTAYHLAAWYADNRFCGRCGARTEHDEAERALRCTGCGRVIYPQLVPAVIVGVIDGDRILLTKYANREMSFYALIAGFTEIGETLEECVAREVMEEVGLRVKNLRYYKSQPWGSARDILMGFFCDVDGATDIRLQEDELKEGIWVRREDIEGQSDDFSLTHEMMMVFKEGREPKA